MRYPFFSSLIAATALLAGCNGNENQSDTIQFAGIKDVKVTDSFWQPKLKQWESVTANDVLDKFERDSVPGNFSKVANGDRDTHNHAGLPWFDGLIYESIRGIADLMVQNPDAALKARTDSIIDKIALAQASEPEGFINTYTQLTENDHRWGENGGLLRWMHDVYNSGMLVEAGVHYYKATGETKLLEVATKVANLMSEYMGPAPKHNIVPAHSGTEEALVKLYQLYASEPELKERINAPVDADSYLRLAEYWIDSRGDHCGLPNWGGWGNEEAEKWIKANTYADTTVYGTHSRPSFGPYAQDSIPLTEQQTIEGHAVRATLYLTGVAAAATVDGNQDYIDAAKRLWDNMAGRRMYVTGGVGAISFDEKFGADYYLPSEAYLETCAAVGAGFFSQRLNELTGDARYMDEYERTLYNGVLTGISLSGDNYTYQNPLNSTSHSRWEWHSCPCCPPMFLKFMGAMPGFIYSHKGNDLYVNLYAGSSVTMPADGTDVKLTQSTNYPWQSMVTVEVEPEKEAEFAINLRIPGWARSEENAHGLYNSLTPGQASVAVNHEEVPVMMHDGYARIERKWNKGDVVELILPMTPRFIIANEAVEDLKDQVAIAVGPLIYCLEGCDNEDLAELSIDASKPLKFSEIINDLDNATSVEGTATTADGKECTFTAIPYYLLGNRTKGAPYKVWMPVKK